MNRFLATLAFAGVAVSAMFAADEPTKVCVFKQGENNSLYYRIPALIRADDNSLIAIADQRATKLNDLPNTISVVYKRSTDNGATWSEMKTIAQGNSSTGKTYGDPAVVKDAKTGTLLCIYSGDNGFWVSNSSKRAGFYYSKSTDNGVTWTEPTAFTDQVYSAQSSIRGAFAASGRALQLKSGRIMFVANSHCSDTSGQTVYEYVYYTDDLGTTWHIANANDTKLPSQANGNESKLMELDNGDLLMSIRTSGTRRFSKSTDGGKTWSSAYYVNSLPDPDCNGDIIRYPSSDGRTRLLHSIPANSSVRRDVSVYLSYDEGENWLVSKKLINTYSAYSSLEVLNDGTIGCLVEEGKWDSNISGADGFDLYFMRFSLDWLTDGADTGNFKDNQNAQKYTVTIGDSENGSVKVYGSFTEIKSGDEVTENSELTIVAHPDKGYKLTTITVDGEPIEGNTHTITANCTISALFEFEPYSHYDGKIMSADYSGRFITSFDVTDGTHTATVTGPGNGTEREVFADATDVALTTYPGATLSFSVNGSGEWLQTYVYIDYDNDGIFTPLLDENGIVQEGSELLAFNGYRNGGSTFKNSVGTKLSSGRTFIATPNLPTIKLSNTIADGKYRMRYKADWDCIDPFGNQDENNSIQRNCGVIIDFSLNIDKTSGINNIAADSINQPTEYFNLNGMRVDNHNLMPGIYISRQGTKVQKIVVK